MTHDNCASHDDIDVTTTFKAGIEDSNNYNDSVKRSTVCGELKENIYH
jgi:hypothetical protein